MADILSTIYKNTMLTQTKIFLCLLIKNITENKNRK